MVSFDPCQGDATAKGLRAAVLREDWAGVRSVFDPVGDPELSSFHVSVVSDVAGAERWLAQLARVYPRETLPRLLYGARLVVWAWEARGSGPGKQVSRQNMTTFWERLTEAEDAFDSVLELDPENVDARWQLLITSRGRQLGIDETKARFDQVVELCPGHLRAHQQMLQQLCVKWGGSNDMMHAFARDSMWAAPAGSPLGGLVAMAHIEHWCHDFNNATIGTFRYFKKPEVRASLHEAAERSVRHPDFTLRPGWLGVPNDFAMALSLAGAHRAAAQQFRLIAGRATPIPWSYATSSATAFFHARRFRALLGF